MRRSWIIEILAAGAVVLVTLTCVMGARFGVPKLQGVLPISASSSLRALSQVHKTRGRALVSPSVSRVSPAISATDPNQSATPVAAWQTQILSRTVPPEKRCEILYRLTETHSAAALNALIEIIKSPVKNGNADLRFDVALRITALEALDQRIAAGEASEAVLRSVLEVQKNATLHFLTQVSLEGVVEGRPGKLTRFIDRTFAEAERS